MMRRVAPAFVLVCLAAFPLTAQSPAQAGDTIPKELVALLLRGPGASGSDTFDIKIGAPADFPRELLPDDATAAVSMVSGGQTAVVVEAPKLTDDLRAWVSKAEAAGWITSGPGMPMRGLMSSSSAVMQTVSLCQGDRYMSALLSERPAGGRYVRISLTTDPRRGNCQPLPRYGGPSYFADVTVPMLRPPAGSRTFGGGGMSSSSDSYEQRLRIDTKLSPEAVVQHYVAQMQSAGWHLDGRADAEGVAIARLTMNSSLKELVVANLVANVMPDGDRDVVFRLMRDDPNRRRMPGGAGAGVRIGGLPGSTCCD